MPVNSVEYLVSLFGSMTMADYNVMQLFNRHLPILNAAQTAVWKLLTTRKRHNNWFVVPSQAATPAGSDYFAAVTQAAREYTLPPSFHHLRLIEPVPAAYDYLRFDRCGMDTQSFRELRASPPATVWGDRVAYDIVGANPGRIMFGEYPPASIELRLWFCRTPTEITAITGTLSEFPIETIPLMASWAAAKIRLGIKPAEWQGFKMQWQGEVEEIVFGDTRDDTGPTVAVGYLE